MKLKLARRRGYVSLDLLAAGLTQTCTIVWVMAQQSSEQTPVSTGVPLLDKLFSFGPLVGCLALIVYFLWKDLKENNASLRLHEHHRAGIEALVAAAEARGETTLNLNAVKAVLLSKPLVSK